MDVRVQLFHRQLYPAAGFQNLNIRVSACDSYPGEQVVIDQGIFVTPVFEQSLEIIDDLTIQSPTQETIQSPNKIMASGLQASSPLDANSVRSIPQAPVEQAPLLNPISSTGLPGDDLLADARVAESSAQPDRPEPVAGTSSTSAGASEMEHPKLKVVRNPSDDFWEKE